MTTDKPSSASLPPTDSQWAERRVQQLRNLEIAVTEAWEYLHDDKALAEKLRELIANSEAFIREITTHTSVIAPPATVFDALASLPSPDSISHFPPPPQIASSQRETVETPPGSVGPVLDLTAAVEVEKDDPSKK